MRILYQFVNLVAFRRCGCKESVLSGVWTRTEAKSTVRTADFLKAGIALSASRFWTADR